VVYLYLDRARLWLQKLRSRRTRFISEPAG
jgi:hypothetical protein